MNRNPVGRRGAVPLIRARIEGDVGGLGLVGCGFAEAKTTQALTAIPLDEEPDGVYELNLANPEHREVGSRRISTLSLVPGDRP